MSGTIAIDRPPVAEDAERALLGCALEHSRQMCVA